LGFLRAHRRDLPPLPSTSRFGSPGENSPGWHYDRRIERIELAINRTRRLFTAFAMASAIGGLVGSPAAVADDDPPPPPPAPEPAHLDVPELPREQCLYINIFTPCEEEFLPPLPDAPGTPDGP
jgi:hypothetical protein